MILFYILFVCAVLHSSCAATIDEYKTYKNFRFYKVVGENDQLKDLIDNLTNLTEIPFHNVRGTEAHLLIAPELVEIFEEAVLAAGLKAEIEVEDYSKIIELEKQKSDQRDDNGFSWTAYHDVDVIYKFLDNSTRSHPEWTQLIIGGQSYEGRKLFGIRINTSPGMKEGKPVVFIESGIHAREWITPATTTYFIHQLLTSTNADVVNLRNQFDWRIFPTVNPDGYHYSFTRDRMWRKTRSKSKGFCYGADPNRNWDYNWLQHGASNRPCDYQTYGGSKPFSEVETRTLSEYLSGIENLLAYVAFHSDAQMLIVPYSDSVEHTSNYNDLIKIGKTSLEYGRQVNNAVYKGPATAAEILYKASGGSMDWVRYHLGIPIVYTYELRGTYFHWPPSRIHEQGDEVTQMMIGLFHEAKNLGYF